MKKILGLDLGTNSIGWALVEIDDKKRTVRILGLGSRILSMDAGEIKTFESGGKLKSKTAQKTEDKMSRKLNERYLLRRDRLHCVLNILGALPKHYEVSINFETDKGFRNGKFKKGSEPKLAYFKNDKGKFEFLFKDSYNEMVKEFGKHHPDLLKARNGKERKIPYDWTLYYLRKKALKDEISLEELSWVILSFNQKRGYEKAIGEGEKKQKKGQLFESFIGKVDAVNLCENKNDINVYEIVLIDPDSDERRELYRYKEESKIKITNISDLKEIEIISKYDDEGGIQENKIEYTINEIRNLKVEDVKFGEKSNQFEVVLETGWCKIETSKSLPKWKGKHRDFIIKTKYDSKGNLKGVNARSIKSPDADDWTLQKLKTDTDLSSFNANNHTKGVASFIYSNLLKDPNQKIKGNLVTTIDRKYYREELNAIFKCQKQYYNELTDIQLFKKAIDLLYPNNETHRKQLEKLLLSSDILPFSKLISDDVLLYQRDLKSKKSLIANCNYEKRINNKTSEEIPLKVVPKSNPYYQEFRIWQFIKRLKIFEKEGLDENGETFINKNVTENVLTLEIKEQLFEFLNDREHITQSVLLKHLFGKDASKYKWNYENEHLEPCNETRYNFILRFNKIEKGLFEKILSKENEYKLWHFFYSVKKREEFITGIETLFKNILEKANLPMDYLSGLIKNFKTFNGYNSNYGAYSEKALKKLIPFLRVGRFWSKEDVEDILKNCIHEIKKEILIKEGIQGEIEDFQGLWISSACYLVYGRYSEVGELQYWKTPNDIENYLRNEFKQHSLNNPVVEKVLVETLNIVKDIWIHFGKSGVDENGAPIYKKIFDRIHIELGREMRKNIRERESENKRNNENKKTNDRIIKILKELKNENQDVKPRSQYQQEKLRLIEDDLLSSIEYDKDSTKYDFKCGSGSMTRKEIREFVKKDVVKIKKSELERYKLWLEQRYQSPYTEKFIKLSDLFNREKYEVEHIFPQERITLNAMYNKVIAETEVNKIKGAKTAYQFILDANEKEIYCKAHGEKVSVINKDSYERLVKRSFVNEKKQEILLSREIPDRFTNSQLNNARYISKMAMKLLSNIVREKGEDTFRSKNVLPVTGMITTQLKKDWKLNDVWNKLIQPRFERLNKLTDSTLFGDYEKINGHDVFVNRVPEELEKNFDKKRIDHRHHAMDALTIALVTQDHVNYLNNIYSSDNKEDSSGKLVYRQQLKNKLTETRKNKEGEKSRYFLPPAHTKEKDAVLDYTYFYQGSESKVFKNIAFEALQNIIISFKQKKYLIRQRSNKFKRWNEKLKKYEVVEQKNLNKKENYNIRQRLHEDTYYGKVKLKFKKEVPLIQALNEPENIVNKKLKKRAQKEISFGKTKKEIIKLLNNIKKNFEEIDFDKVKMYYWEVDEKGEGTNVATRFNNFLETFAEISSDKIMSKIESVTDKSIQRILKRHLEKYDSIEVDISKVSQYLEFVVSDVIKARLKEEFRENSIIEEIEIDNKRISKIDVFCKAMELSSDNYGEIKHNPQLAFSPDGIKSMNQNMKELNGGKDHKPIYKVRLFTALGNKFPVSEEKGIKSKKIVNTASGSNFYCAVYEHPETKERKYLVPTLRETIENLKSGNAPCKEKHIDNETKKVFFKRFVLIPNDLVYVPTQEEICSNTKVDFTNLTPEQKSRIYKFRDGSINEKEVVQFNFMPANYASMIYKIFKDGEKYFLNNGKQLKGEITLTTDKDKSQNTIDDEIQIRKECWKLEVDRLGNIIGVIGNV